MNPQLDFRYRGSRFRSLGFRGLGFRGLGFAVQLRVLGFGVQLRVSWRLDATITALDLLGFFRL